MNLMERKKNINDRVANLEQRIRERYDMAFQLSGKDCFKTGNDEFIILTGLSWANAVVVEYAESEQEARKNIFEDGDLFYMEELDENEMFDAIIKEIEDIVD